MIGEPGSHRRSTRETGLFCFSKFMMREAKVVGRPDQVHASFQCEETTSSMTTFSGEHRQTFSERPVEPFDKRRVQNRSSA
jgi:hypothetical protein